MARLTVTFVIFNRMLRFKAGTAGDALEVSAKRARQRIETANHNCVVIILRAREPFSRIDQDAMGVAIILSINRVAAARHIRIFRCRVKTEIAVEVFALQMIDLQRGTRIALRTNIAAYPVTDR